MAIDFFCFIFFYFQTLSEPFETGTNPNRNRNRFLIFSNQNRNRTNFNFQPRRERDSSTRSFAVFTSCWRGTAFSSRPLCRRSPRRRPSAWRRRRGRPVRTFAPRPTPWSRPGWGRRPGCTVCCPAACRYRSPSRVGLWCVRGRFSARIPPFWSWSRRYTFCYTVNKTKKQKKRDVSPTGRQFFLVNASTACGRLENTF